MLAIIQNIKHAIRNNETVIIGGGVFTSSELAALLGYIAMLEENNNAKH